MNTPLFRKKKSDPFSIIFTIMVIFNLSFYQLYPFSIAFAEDSQPSATEDQAMTEEEEEEEEENTNDDSEEDDQEEESSSDEDDGDKKESTENEEGSNEEESGEKTAELENNETSGESTENPTEQGTSQQIEVTTNTADSLPLTASSDILPEQEDPAQQEQEPLWRSCALDEQQESLMESPNCQECNEKTTCEEVKACLEIKIENNNSTVIENNVTANSNTGNNIIAEDATAENNTMQDDIENEQQQEQASSDEGNQQVFENSKQGNATLTQNENVIDTSTAVAENIVINDVNTNITTDNGERNIQEIADYVGDINLLDIFLAILKNSGASGEKTAAAIEIFNKNYAQIENIATSKAYTGNNVIDSNGLISTGNAQATTTIVNIANQNIVGSNWLLSVINVFGTWIGDLIVPGEAVIELPEGATYADLEVINNNTAEIKNDVSAQSDTGNNTAEGTPESSITASDSSIATGSAYAANYVKTIVNTNIVKNNWFMLIINNMGSWAGSVFGYDDVSGKITNMFSFDFDSLLNDSNTPQGSLTVHNDNYASISSTALASATTGSNKISGTGEIATGNAYSQSSILNFINSNFVGDNWLFAMVNVFGKWDGDVVFAYPDLQVSITDSKEKVYPNENIAYHIVVTNIGTAAASNTQVSLNASNEIYLSSDQTSWNIPTLEPGSSQDFFVEAKSTSVSPLTPFSMTANAQVSTETKEREKNNNSAQDETTLVPSTPHATTTKVLNSSDDYNYNAKLSISRITSSSGSVNPGELVKHSIIVKNKSDVPLYSVILKDDVSDAVGNKLGTYSWELGNLDVDDTLLIEYESITNPSVSSVALQYEALARGEDPANNEVESRSVSIFLTFFGSTAHAANNDFSELNDNGEFISNNSLQEAVLGEMEEKNFRLPLWIWILSSIAYFLALNWALFPSKRRTAPN